jgi:hypothetical protein
MDVWQSAYGVGGQGSSRLLRRSAGENNLITPPWFWVCFSCRGYHNRSTPRNTMHYLNITDERVHKQLLNEI